MAFMSAVTLQLLLVPTLGMNLSPNQLGQMDRTTGVTRYSPGGIKQIRRKEGFWWPDASSSSRSSEALVGAVDLAENISWGWHHPNGFFNIATVGGPLIDGDMNIYLCADDAVRKFDISGDLIWTYGPRGQPAAACALTTSSVRRMKQPESDVALDDSQAEAELKPSWMGGNDGLRETDADQVKEGDLLEVREGMKYAADGTEFYKAGDIGEITKIADDGKKRQKAFIRWKRTGHQSISSTIALNKRFKKIDPVYPNYYATASMLVGTTTSGVIFAIDTATGEEVWVTQVSDELAGVKGSVFAKDGVIVFACRRCVDRYCYRHRYLTNPLWKANSKVCAVSAVDGHVLWSFKPISVLWNFLPDFADLNGNATVFFQDIEGSAYALDIQSGAEVWATEGFMGTFSQGHVIVNPVYSALYVMLVKWYDKGNGYEAKKICNPQAPRGIDVNCDTWSYRPSVVHMLSLTTGQKLHETDELPYPPASGTLGRMNTPAYHARLIIATGHNCHYNSPSEIRAFDPGTLDFIWRKTGPTLWSYYCAGDKEGGDIRRALGGREKCEPGAWTLPVIDAKGDMFIGNQVGELQRWGNNWPIKPRGGGKSMRLLSTLGTGVAFQDAAIALAPGVMAVTTCTSLIIFQADNGNYSFKDETWKKDLDPHILPYEPLDKPFGVYGPASHDTPQQHQDGVYFRPYDDNPKTHN